VQAIEVVFDSIASDPHTTDVPEVVNPNVESLHVHSNADEQAVES
jgi:hypothetical protein